MTVLRPDALYRVMGKALLRDFLKRIRGGLDAAGSRQKMTCVKCDADKVSPDHACRDQRGAGPTKGIKDHGGTYTSVPWVSRPPLGARGR